jgi:predicted ArsR family transcriptional regulator
MAGLAAFNNRPPKPEYAQKIIRVLKRKQSCRLIDLTKATKLTKTQVMCSLDELLTTGVVIISLQSDSKFYSLKDKDSV